MDCPYYNLVPKDFSKNLKWRADILQQCMTDKKAQREFRQMCSEDLLFYLNTFNFTLNPKEYPDSPVRPFITYSYQDEALARINDAIGDHDIDILKSREMGATWIVLALFEWRWRYKHDQAFLLASRNEDAVDTSNNPDTLFAKIDFILFHHPNWLKPNYVRTGMSLHNKDTNSNINGASATGDIARGGRRTAMLWDELPAWERGDGYRALASTAAVTNCRIVLGTPAGVGDAFHKVCTEWPEKNHLRMHWTAHPEQNKGMYSAIKGQLNIIDKGFRFPVDYKFNLDGKIRSPYYDKFCIKLPIASMVAKELDMDFGGSGSQFFDQGLIKTLRDRDPRTPFLTGEVIYEDTGKFTSFQPMTNGIVKLWTNLSQKGLPPDRNYIMGIDISNGTGASSSVISIADTTTGEKVAEIISSNLRPEEWARLSVAVAHWFYDAFMIWEANGPGRSFGSQVMDLGYRNVYYKIDESKFPPKISETPGWFSTKVTKKTLLTEYCVSLVQGLYVNRSLFALNECTEIVYLADGSIGHARSVNVLDPSAEGENHGDCVIADALASKGLKARPAKTVEASAQMPVGSFGARRAERDRSVDDKNQRMIFA